MLFLFHFTTEQYLMLFLFARQIHFIDSSDEAEEYLLQLQELQFDTSIITVLNNQL